MAAATLIESPTRAWSRARLIAAFFAFGTFWGSWGAVLPAVQERVHLSDGRLGLALLGTVAGALVSMRALAGPLERLGPAGVPVSLVLTAAFVVPLATSRSAIALVGWLVLFGVASGMLDVSVNAGGAAVEKRHGVSVLPLAHGCFSFGLLGGGLAAGLLRQAGFSPVGVMTVVAVTLVLAAVVPVRPGVGRAKPLQTGTPAGAHDPLGRRALAALGLLCGLSFLIEDALQSWGSVHLEHTFHARPAISGLAPAMFGLAAGIARITMPRWSGQRLPMQIVARGALLAGAGLLLTALAPWSGLAIVGLALAGFGLASIAPLLMGIAGASGATRAVSIVSSVAYLGFVIGPPLTGGVAGFAGLRVAFAMLAGVAVLLGFVAQRSTGPALPAVRSTGV